MECPLIAFNNVVLLLQVFSFCIVIFGTAGSNDAVIHELILVRGSMCFQKKP